MAEGKSVEWNPHDISTDRTRAPQYYTIYYYHTYTDRTVGQVLPTTT